MATSSMQGMMTGTNDTNRRLMERLGYAVPQPTAALRAPTYGAATATPAPAPAPTAPPAPAPAPTAPQRMSGAGGYQSESYVPALARESQIYQRTQASTPDPFWAGVHQGLSPEEDADLERYIQTLYAMPSFTGSNERNRSLASMYADRLRKNRKSSEIDMSGMSKIGDTFNGLQGRLMATLAARGIGGSGIEGGALSHLAGQEGVAEGDYVRGLIEQRRQEQMQRDMFDQKMMYDLLGQSTEARRQDEADSGIMGDILGIGGSLLGGIL